MKNEEEFVKKLIEAFPSKNPLVSLPIGDDCAILQGPHGKDYLITVDGLVEGIHFLKGETYDTICSKLFKRNISDIYAMGGVPEFAIIHSLIPSSHIKELLKGLSGYSEELGVELIGGDHTSANEDTPRSLTMTLMGTVPRGKAYKRSGAQEGDVIYLSSMPGLTALGLDLINNGIDGYENIKDRYRYFFLPGDTFMEQFRSQTSIHSAIDISDGLMKDLNRILTASEVAAILDKDSFLLQEDAVAAAEALGEDPLRYIREGGDDYVILFTAGRDYTGPGIRIGQICEGSGISFTDGEKYGIKGYDHMEE